MKTILAGIIFHNDKILIAQRKHGKNQEYLWEFPGGKLEEGETLEQCLHRELWEELRLRVDIKRFFMHSRYTYPQGEIDLQAYLCTSLDEDISFLDSHEQVKWVMASELSSYTFAPADKPIVAALQADYASIWSELTTPPHG